MQDYQPQDDDRSLMTYEEEVRYVETMKGALHRALRKQLEAGWAK